MRIGIDIGTTTICAVVLDDNFKQLETITAPSGKFINSALPFERAQVAEGMIDNAKKIIDDLMDRFPVDKIGISCQMHGVVYLDSKNQVISPLYTWQDQRGALLADEILCLTGYKVAPGYGLATHYYNLKNGLVPLETTYICTIGDALAAILCGNVFMHVSNAASFGLYSLSKNDFDETALLKLAIERSILPGVLKTSTAIGEYRGAKIFCALGDNQCSFMGCVPCPDSDILVNIGTGGQVSWKVSSPIDISGSLEIRPLDKGEYLCVGSSLCAGRAYAILAKLFSQIRETDPSDAYSFMNALADEDGAALTVDTRFSGTRADPDILGSINRISEDNFTAGALVRGVINGIAEELFGMYVPSPNHTRVVLSGNGARKNPALCRAISKTFGLPTIISPYAEEAARGAAL